MELKDIKAILDLMKKYSVSEFEMEKQDFKVKLKRGGNGALHTSPVEDASGSGYLLPTPSGGQTIPVAQLPASLSGDTEIRSPMIGTFYRAPSPEAGHYIEIGMEVTPETVVCIIEAMKVMNEIKAEVKGVITQALVENAKPVEFGQPLFKVRPT